MTYQVIFDQQSSTAVVVATGDLDFDLVLSAFDEIDQNWGAEATNILWDFRVASFHRFTIGEILTIIERKIEQSRRRQSVKAAALVIGISNRHLMRMFSDLGQGSKPHLEVFDQPEQAVAYFGLALELE